mgnify:FL=1|jgi:hypothetical protein
MTRGIQLKQLSATDLGHLNLPVDLLGPRQGDFDADSVKNALSMLSGELSDGADGVPGPVSVAREVRICLEETLAILTDALGADAD